MSLVPVLRESSLGLAPKTERSSFIGRMSLLKSIVAVLQFR